MSSKLPTLPARAWRASPDASGDIELAYLHEDLGVPKAEFKPVHTVPPPPPPPPLPIYEVVPPPAYKKSKRRFTTRNIVGIGFLLVVVVSGLLLGLLLLRNHEDGAENSVNVNVSNNDTAQPTVTYTVTRSVVYAPSSSAASSITASSSPASSSAVPSAAQPAVLPTSESTSTTVVVVTPPPSIVSTTVLTTTTESPTRSKTTITTVIAAPEASNSGGTQIPSLSALSLASAVATAPASVNRSLPSGASIITKQWPSGESPPLPFRQNTTPVGTLSTQPASRITTAPDGATIALPA